MTEISTFDLAGSARDGADFDIGVLKYGQRKGDFLVTLTGHGLEASRHLTHQELADLRDWITLALAKQSEIA